MRRRNVSRCAAVTLLALALSSCAGMQQAVEDNPKAVLGTVLGAAAGGGIAALAGGGPGAIAGAAVGGALLGGLVGHHLDNRDKQMAARAAQQAFENNRAGQASMWRNPDSGNSGSITPTRTYQLANGQYCREYRQTIVVGGQQQQAYGTACRQPDGTWSIQS
jgi:surface antigen